MTDLIQRPRRLRKSPALRAMFEETTLSLNDLVLPIFVEEEIDDYKAVEAMPGVMRIPEKHLAREIERIANAGIRSVMTFGISHHTDETGSDAWREDGLVARMSRICKQTVPEMIVMSDTCFCEYTSHGHCGVLCEHGVDNDATLENLGKQAVVAAAAGADFIAPSAAMDGQVQAIRQALDAAGFKDTAIMSYSTKFASSFYGPFREAAGSALKGDRKSYQMNPMNRREAIRESLLDEAQGADCLMVKPAGAYLDIVRELRERTELPIGAYQVSGEYAMIKFAALAGAIDEEKVVLESLGSIKRAGADLIFSYFALDRAETKIMRSFLNAQKGRVTRMKVRSAPPHHNPLPKGTREPSALVSPRPIKRFIPKDRRPMHNPPLWQVIGIGIVLSHAVIPNRNIIRLPAPTHLKLRFSDMGE